MEFKVGQKIGDYEILGHLGSGGMGQVYRVRNRLTDRLEAMKVLLPDMTSDSETEARFMAEIRTLAGFHHPNIAQFHNAFQIDDQLAMVMELVEGTTIKDRAQRGTIPIKEALDYVLQLLTALNYAHSRGVVHRDVKPANLMVTPQGVVKLMDFGLARSETQERLTRPGTTVGSRPYMSPEQLLGGAVDGRTDLYSVGIVSYELLTGRRPFYSNDVYTVVHQQLNMAPQPPIEINPLISKQLNDVILLSLAKTPDKRIQSAEAFSTQLRAVTVHSVQPGPKVRPRIPPRHPVALFTPKPKRPPSADRATPVFLPSASPAAPSVHRPSLQARPITPPAASPAPPLWKRAGWVLFGAVLMILAARALVQIRPFLKLNLTNGSSASPDDPGPTRAASVTLDQAVADIRTQLDELESQDKTIHSNLLRKRRRDLGPQYTQMHSHLQMAEMDLENRDIVATRKEMVLANTEISGLNLNLSR